MQIDKALNLSDKDTPLDSSDFGDLKLAIENFGKKSKNETREIETLKREMEDYEEDLKDLDELKHSAKAFNLTETKGAKRLFTKVNQMLSKVDTLVDTLEDKEKKIAEMKATEGRSEEEISRDDENLVTVQELIDAVRKLQSTPDSSKLERIAEVSKTSFSDNCIIQWGA